MVTVRVAGRSLKRTSPNENGVGWTVPSDSGRTTSVCMVPTFAVYTFVIGAMGSTTSISVGLDNTVDPTPSIPALFDPAAYNVPSDLRTTVSPPEETDTAPVNG